MPGGQQTRPDRCVKDETPEESDDRDATPEQTARPAHTAARASVLKPRDAQRSADRFGTGVIDIARQTQQSARPLEPPRLGPVERRIEVATIAVAQPQTTFGCRERRHEETSHATVAHLRSQRRLRAPRRLLPVRIASARRACIPPGKP